MTDRRITIAHTYDERLINTAEICVESLGDISQPEHSPDMAASLEPLARWERRMRADGQASSTIKNRLINIRAMTRFNGTEPHLLGRAEIDHWLDRELAPNSKNAYWRSANEWFHFLLDEGLIEQHPFTGLRKRPQPRQGLPRPLTSGEQRVVLETATPRMLAWLKLGLRAGLRVSETARIRGEYIRGGVLTILGKGGKTRIIPAHQEIIELAEEMPRIGPWFISRSTGGPITPQWLTCCVTEHFSNCGISGSYHRCRHSFATDLLAEGVDIRIVQELLGHESLNTTAIYTRVRESQLRDAVSRLPRVSGL